MSCVNHTPGCKFTGPHTYCTSGYGYVEPPLARDWRQMEALERIATQLERLCGLLEPKPAEAAQSADRQRTAHDERTCECAHCIAIRAIDAELKKQGEKEQADFYARKPADRYQKP